MTRKRIEFVCTANRGRSPVAELIANNTLKIMGAFGDFQAISSGTLVDAISKGKMQLKVSARNLVALACR